MPSGISLKDGHKYPLVTILSIEAVLYNQDLWFGLLCFVLSFINLFILLYNIALALPYVDLNPPWVYMCSPSWTPLPPPFPSHFSGSSQCTSPKHPVSCIKPGPAICFTYDNLHVSMPFSHIILPSPSPTESKRDTDVLKSLLVCFGFITSVS